MYIYMYVYIYIYTKFAASSMLLHSIEIYFLLEMSMELMASP